LRSRSWRDHDLDRLTVGHRPVAVGDAVETDAAIEHLPGLDPPLEDLGQEVLDTQSAEFRTRWAAHNVRFHDTGTKELHHPVVGDLSLTYNRMELAADPGLAITIWTAEPGSKSAQALGLLGSWAATPQQPTLQEAPDHR
jgi:hypothetical protein